MAQVTFFEVFLVKKFVKCAGMSSEIFFLFEFSLYDLFKSCLNKITYARPVILMPDVTETTFIFE